MKALEPVEYRHRGKTLNGWLAEPDKPGPHPGVLVVHDARGQNELVRRRAVDLAAMGYVALVADMYGGGRRFLNSEDMREPFEELQGDTELLRTRLLAGFDVLREYSAVDPARIGAVGYCMGGQCVLELARSGAEARAVVSFHGLLETRMPARRGELKASVLVLAGAHDPYAPMDHIRAFQEEMAAAEADWHLTVYGQGWHAFTDPEADQMAGVPGLQYDPVLDALSWSQACDFLSAHLRR